MQICFQASETVKLPVAEQEISLKHYLRQPQRLVKAIADPQLTKQLSPELYQLKMRPLNFMDIYHFQPIVTLKVWTGASGTVYLKSEDCEIKGIDYINNRFSLNLKGKLSPKIIGEQTYLQGQANLEVKVELPPPLWLTPKPLLEVAGNGLLKSVLIRIKQRIMNHLIYDYQHWIQQDQTQELDLNIVSLQQVNN
jgi:hypothetical protein